MRTARPLLLVLTVFVAGYACGSGGSGMAGAAATLFEFTGGSLAGQLAKAGDPPITAPFGIAERVPNDETRHFTFTVATENRDNREDAVAVYALTDGHGSSGKIWGANILAFAHSDMSSGGVSGLEVDVGNLGTPGSVPVTGVNIFAIGPRPSDVALGILNELAAGPGGFREGIAFHSTAPGTAVTEALIRVHPDFGTVATGIDLREARFTGPAIATPGFTVDASGGIQSTTLATGRAGYACVDATGRLFASAMPCPVE